MSELLTGYTALCDAPAGVDTLYLCSIADCETGESLIETLTYANGIVTALALITGKQFFPFLVEQESVSITDMRIGERPNKAYAREQTVTARLHGNTAEMITMFDSMDRGRVMVIAKLNDTTNELYFYEKGGLAKVDRTVEQGFDGFNGNDMVITGKQIGRGLKISNTILATLLSPAA